MNVQRSLFREVILFGFELRDNTTEATKIVDHTTETKWFDFLVLWHINLCALFKAKAILVEEQKRNFLVDSWGDDS